MCLRAPFVGSKGESGVKRAFLQLWDGQKMHSLYYSTWANPPSHPRQWPGKRGTQSSIHHILLFCLVEVFLLLKNRSKVQIKNKLLKVFLQLFFSLRYIKVCVVHASKDNHSGNIFSLPSRLSFRFHWWSLKWRSCPERLSSSERSLHLRSSKFVTVGGDLPISEHIPDKLDRLSSI